MSDSTTLLLGLIIGAVIVFFYMGGHISSQITGQAVERQTQLTNEQGQTVYVNSGSNMCSVFSTNYPLYIQNRSANCINAGGTWVCEHNKIGCYNIPFWNWQTSCSANELQILKFVCNSMQGIWQCDSHNVGCERSV